MTDPVRAAALAALSIVVAVVAFAHGDVKIGALWLMVCGLWMENAGGDA